MAEKDNSGHAMTWAPVFLQSLERDAGILDKQIAPHFPSAFASLSSRKVHNQASSGVLVMAQLRPD